MTSFDLSIGGLQIDARNSMEGCSSSAGKTGSYGTKRATLGVRGARTGGVVLRPPPYASFMQ